MQIDPSLHSVADNYKLLTNLVVPRPIAWVTSLNASGVINLAPFSFFNPCRPSLFRVSRLGAHFRGNVVPMRNVE
jgi:flavin reductase (DIM6/NTAB) family NADH-FMN oxidoreductase RutF